MRANDIKTKFYEIKKNEDTIVRKHLKYKTYRKLLYFKR